MNIIDEAIDALVKAQEECFKDSEYYSVFQSALVRLSALKETHVIIPKADIPEGLLDALEKQREPYERALYTHNKRQSSFAGMNKDRPKKDGGLLIYETAALVAKHLGDE